MGRGAGKTPPPDMLRQARDVVAPQTRDRGDIPPVAPVYVNDVQPSVETDGSMTLRMAYHGPEGAGEPVAVTMPMGLFMELVHLAPRLVGPSGERYLKQGKGMLTVAQASGMNAEEWQPEGVTVELPPPPPAPTSLEDHRG